MKAARDLSVTVLANPVQADTLTWMLPLTPPRRRISLAAAFLGTTAAEIFRAAGMTDADRNYYTYRRGGERADLPSMLLVRLAKVINVPFGVLWDEEALEAPAEVIRVASYLGYGAKHEKTKRPAGTTRRGSLRLAAG